MKINHFKKLKDNRYEITFDGNIKIIFYDDIIVKYNLLSGKEFSVDFINEIRDENDSLDSFYLSIKYINTKLRSEKEIRKFLEKKEFDLERIEKTIRDLEDKGYLDSKIYIKSFVNDQVNLTSNGYYKIIKTLEDKGFEEKDIRVILDDIKEDVWQLKLDKIITKKIKLNTKYSGNKLKQKIIHDLLNLGYGEELIYNSLENYDFKDNNLLEKEYKKLKEKLKKKYSNEKELKFHVNNKLIMKGFSLDDINNLDE